MLRGNKILKLVMAVLICQGAGAVGSLFTVPAIPNWYASLEKPIFAPPNWLFGPAWITLYLLMGVSVYLIWLSLSNTSGEQNIKARGAFWLFWVHLAFNAVWSPIFFGLKNPGLALANIIIIWLLIIILMVKFWKINKWSTYLLIPYLLWVSFATVLNYFIWYLN